jgi:tripartite-type tricarboxylate transporter receptor subunit TctC
MLNPASSAGFRFTIIQIIAVMVAACGASVHAQPYPSRLVRMITPQAPGSSVEAMLRLAAQAWAERNGQPAIVENRPGANTIVATDSCRKAPPDGYTLCMVTSSGYLNPYLYSKLPFDLQKDLVPITNLVMVQEMVAMHPSVPASSWQEVLAWSKANPGKLNYAGFGPGSTPQMTFEWLKRYAGLDATHVPYKTVVDAFNGFLAGESQLVAVGVSTLHGHVKSGKAKGLFVLGDKRHALAPTVPTASEAGAPDSGWRTWFGMSAPAGTPREVIDKANSEFNAIFAIPAFREKVIGMGFEPATSTPEEFARFLSTALANAAAVVKVSGAKLD